MKLVEVLKLLICFVLIVPLFATNASANANYDYDELMQYEGYGKAMYESIVEQTTFITGQYTDNKEYVSESINEIKDYASFWRDQLVDEENCAFDSAPFSCIGSIVERGGAYVLTVGDWIKNLFSDYDDLENAGVDPVPESPYFVRNGDGIKIIDGYYFRINGDNGKKTYLVPRYDFIYDKWISDLGGYYTFVRISTESTSSTKRVAEGTQEDMRALTANLNSQEPTVGGVLSVAHELWDITIHKELTNELVVMSPSLPNPNIRTINNYLNDNGVPTVQVPKLNPSLVCPDGTRIQMSISGSTFLSVDGTVMLVDKDGTAQIDSQLCNLTWEKPKVDYINGETAITDSDGNWLDVDDDDVLVCLDPEGCELKPVDNSLLEYVKNSYNYATGVLKTATDGLKSLATGAKDLTSLFGTFFSWLPNEMVVLMASGLGITVGLRLFRK